MANDKKFIVKKGLVAPNVDFANGSGTISATYLNSSNTLSFSGNTGQLFSITDSMSGTIFSVNDISGIPSIEVMDTGAVKIAETFGTVSIGANTTSGYKLYVNGNTLFGNSVTLNSTVIANGSVGTSGFVLTSNGTGVYWAAANSGITSVLNANNSTYLQGRTWATPFAIGSTVANTGTFTSVTIDHSGDKAQRFVRTGTNTFSIEHDTSRMYLYNETTGRSIIAYTNDGNVGVGTANPAARLDANGQVRIAPSTGNFSLVFGNAGGNEWEIGGDGARIAITEVGGAERFRIASGGNIGIANTNPGQTLQVDGSVGIKNGLVANGSFGTSGHVLTSNGTAIYWAAANSSISSVLNANNALYLDTFAANNYPRKAENAVITGSWNFSTNGAIWSGHSYTNTYDGSNVYQYIGTGTSTDKIWNIRVLKADNSFSAFTFNYAGVATAPQSFRAPFFYDIDDTAYYANPASTSVFNDLNVDTINANTINANSNILQPTFATTSVAGLHLAYNPEGYMSDHPFLTNDLGNLRLRGGTFTANTTYNLSTAQIDALFDGTPSYFAIASNTQLFPMVLEFTLPKTLFWGSFVGISFGSTSWTPSSVKIESLSQGVWTTCYDTTTLTTEQIFAPVPSGANGTTAFRFTFANPSPYGFRINNIWAYDYASNGWSNLAMPRSGGLMYDDLTVNGHISITSGHALYANGSPGTAGFVLTSNGSASYWANASSISGTITNALTANNSTYLQGRTWQTPFAIGSTTANTGAFTSLTASANVNLDSGALFVDATTNRVGINTTSPSVTLSANGEVSVGQRNSLTLIGLDINSGGTPNFIKIKTKIPVASASADFTVNIKGFNYGNQAMADLKIGWHYYNSTFYAPSLSSSGAWAPTVRLSAEGGFVCIVLSAPSYWPKLYVESMYSSNYNDDYAAGWTWVDEDATGSPIVTVPYKSDFGNQFVMTSSGNVGVGTSTPGQKFVVSNGGAGGVEIIPSGIIQSYNRSTLAYQPMYFDASEILFRNGVTERMRVNSVGNIGIANTNPGQTLQVDGSVGIKNGLVANGSFGTAGQVLTSNGSVVYWAADYANASNITTGTLAEARLPYRMNQNVRTTDSVTFANMTVTGNVVVSGTVTTWNANNITISDNMIYLNANGFNTNPDVGIAASYNDGTYRHTGFFRDATDGVWKVYDQYLPEPDASIYIDTANASFRIADFQANVVNAASVVINNAQAYRQRDGTGTIRTLLTTLSDSSVIVGGYQGTTMINGVNGATYLYGSGSGSTVMTLLSGGNVGIGNTSPTSRLQLNYATGDAGGIRLQQAGWAYSTRIGAVGTSGDQQYWSTNFNAATNAVDVASQYTTYVLQNPSAGIVTFGTSNGAGYAPEERMRIFHNNIKLTPNVATMSSQNIAFEVAPPTLPSSHQPRNFVKLTDQYNNNSNGHDLTIRSFSSGVNYGGWLLRTNWGGSLRLASTQNAFAEANSFPAAYVSITPTSMDMVGLTLNAVGITASANVNLDSGTLFTDATTNRVGIGTTNPVTTLDVRGNISASNGAFNALTTTQSIADTTGSGNGSLRILHPAGGAFSNNQPSVVGAIKIKLPPNTFKSNTMMRMTIKIYDYNGGASGTSRTIEVGGYNYSDAGANWINYFATQSTMGGDDINVRFGNDGGTNCIWIGETSTVWQYPQVYITEFQGGYGSFTQSAWGAGWVISMVSAFDTVTQGPIIAAKPLTTQNYSSYVTGSSANNALYLQGRRWETAGAIGSTVANTGAFTTITASANVNIDTGTLFTDAPNNRVGIGTTTPRTKLEVVGDIWTDWADRFIGTVFSDGTSYRLGINTIANTRDTQIWSESADGTGVSGITFHTGSGPTERMRVSNTGNLGVGTTTPQYRLDVNNAATSSNTFQASFGTTMNSGFWSGIHFGYSEANNTSYRKSAIVFERQDSAARGKIHILNNDVNSSASATLSDSKMTIQYDGNVGVGNTSPLHKLSVNGTGYFGDDITVNGGQVYTGTTQARVKFAAWSDTGYGMGMQSGYTFGGLVNDFAITFQMSGNPTRGFWWGDSGHTNAQGAMALTSDGKLTVATAARIGFGTSDTTVPGATYALEVNGAFAATTKSFVINHPTKEDMKLRYGSLEGPENGVYVRGKLKGSNTIELPDYWTGLVDEDSITVNLTPIGKHQKLYVEDVSNNKIVVGNDNLLSKEINCFYVVYAERKDVEKLVVEY